MRSDVPSQSDDYEIHIKGRVNESFHCAFEELTMTVRPTETVLRGVNLDQAALYGILDRIQALGLELIEIRRLPDRPVLRHRAEQ
ncbi:MAG: hypothetical protein LC799_10680 [Actinobacteria bacterium]|nr:hypothetical protein [Actinomycetota bacterium]